MMDEYAEWCLACKEYEESQHLAEDDECIHCGGWGYDKDGGYSGATDCPWCGGTGSTG